MVYRYNFQFVIDKDGNLVGSRIRGKTPDLLNSYEKQALEAVNKIQNWEPGKVNVTFFVTFYTKNPPQTTLRGIFVEHRRIELLTF